jgi:hypothetical protein
MSCREYQHKISLFLYEELPEAEKPDLEMHLRQCDACRFVFDEERDLHRVLTEDVLAREAPSDLLVESRRTLADALDRLENKRPWWRIPTFSVVFTPMRLLESAALVAMGLALGVYFSNQQAARQIATVVREAEHNSSPIPTNGSVSNLRVVNTNPSTGEVELAGEVIQPLRFQGTLMNDTVRQLLFSALTDASNPGSRLRAVEVLAREPNDQGVKEALIHALTYDDNPGVRLRALEGLKEFAGEQDVRAAFVHALGNDIDAGIRVEAIEALTRNSGDSSVAKMIEENTKQEDNSYIRMKALQFVGSKDQ